jgi:hypothetical protein
MIIGYQPNTKVVFILLLLRIIQFDNRLLPQGQPGVVVLLHLQNKPYFIPGLW